MPPAADPIPVAATLTSSSSSSPPPQPPPRVPGVAPIKRQYLVSTPSRPSDGLVAENANKHDDDAAESATNPANAPDRRNGGGANPTPGATRKERRGQNKARKFEKSQDGERTWGLCNDHARGVACAKGESCRYSHDLGRYLATKPRDLAFPRPPIATSQASLVELARATPDGEQRKRDYLDRNYTTSEPFVKWRQPKPDDDGGADGERGVAHSVDRDAYCPLYHAHQLHAAGAESAARCPAGWKCRYLGAHVDDASSPPDGPSAASVGGLVLAGDAEAPGQNGASANTEAEAEAGFTSSFVRIAPDERNYPRGLNTRLMGKKRYPLPLSRAVLRKLEQEERRPADAPPPRGPVAVDPERVRREHAEEEERRERERAGEKGEHKRTLGQMRRGHGESGAAPGDAAEVDLDELMNAAGADEPVANGGGAASGASAASAATPSQDAPAQYRDDVDLARVRASEKRRLDWRHGELYLAPLTTTGNLPFRRVCASFGSDIHCGEMGLAESYLEGKASEWSLVRRWEGERCFGTQLCGSKPQLLIPAAEALYNEVGEGLDFVDINCGCPIDLVYNKGAGSALLDHAGKLGRIVRGMSSVLGSVPVTIKLRTGTTSKNTAHKLFSRCQTEWGVGAVTLHGRSRKQRYSRLADWEYIGECARALRESVRAHNEEARHADEEEVAPVPIYGNGDVYDWRTYHENRERYGVDGEMVARGALIKPWVFTEIKERRDWDISSRERLDIVRQYCSYGLTHWGSDTQGVNTTRRFLCEALSFQHRYVPVGLLEHLPAAMNDRPPAYRGRDELETLLASPDARDWVRISEWFLGPAPASWNFLPKHKSNSYADGGTEQQG